MSRRKGAVGEREFADVLKRHGFDARRDGRLDDDLAHNVEGWHFEVKRRETLALPAWIEQAIADAKGRKWAVVWRRSREPWRVTLDAEEFLALLANPSARVEHVCRTENDAQRLYDRVAEALSGDDTGPLSAP